MKAISLPSRLLGSLGFTAIGVPTSQKVGQFFANHFWRPKAEHVREGMIDVRDALVLIKNQYGLIGSIDRQRKKAQLLTRLSHFSSIAEQAHKASLVSMPVSLDHKPRPWPYLE